MTYTECTHINGWLWSRMSHGHSVDEKLDWQSYINQCKNLTYLCAHQEMRDHVWVKVQLNIVLHIDLSTSEQSLVFMESTCKTCFNKLYILRKKSVQCIADAGMLEHTLPLFQKFRILPLAFYVWRLHGAVYVQTSQLFGNCCYSCPNYFKPKYSALWNPVSENVHVQCRRIHVSTSFVITARHYSIALPYEICNAGLITTFNKMHKGTHSLMRWSKVLYCSSAVHRIYWNIWHIQN